MQLELSLFKILHPFFQHPLNNSRTLLVRVFNEKYFMSLTKQVVAHFYGLREHSRPTATTNFAVCISLCIKKTSMLPDKSTYSLKSAWCVPAHIFSPKSWFFSSGGMTMHSPSWEDCNKSSSSIFISYLICPVCSSQTHKEILLESVPEKLSW